MLCKAQDAGAREGARADRKARGVRGSERVSGGIQWTTRGMLATIAMLLEVMGALDVRQAALVAEMTIAAVDAPELAALPLHREGLREWIAFCRTPDEWGGATMGAKAIEAMRRDLEATRDALDKPQLFKPLEVMGEARASA